MFQITLGSGLNIDQWPCFHIAASELIPPCLGHKDYLGTAELLREVDEIIAEKSPKYIKVFDISLMLWMCKSLSFVCCPWGVSQ